MKKRRSALITGGLGFIGTHLCRHLLMEEPNLDIVIVDNLSSTQMDYSDLEDRARIFIQDFLNFDEQLFNFDEIYHLASPVGSLGILARNGYVARDILNLTYKAAGMAIAMKAKLLFVSSSEVYGRDGMHHEDAPKMLQEKRGTRMEYALGKLLSEHVLFNLAVENPLRFKICRPFNVIGEGQCAKTGFVSPIFFQRAFAGEDMPVFYGGAQKRSFCHVSDIVRALVAVQCKGQEGQVYNIGNPDNVICIRSMAEKIKALCSSDSKIVDIDPQRIFGRQYIEAFEKIPDIRKVRQSTGWEPHCDLDRCLELIFESYVKQGRQPGPRVSHGRCFSPKEIPCVGR